MPRSFPWRFLPFCSLHRLAAAAGLVAAVLPAGAATSWPKPTLAEQSGYLRTGRYEEVERLCAAWQQAQPKAVRCIRFGQTPEGRPMLALAISQSGALTPEAARQRGLPVVLIQSGIHAGEIDGKDAGFQVLREVLDGQAAPGALKHAVWLFVPVFNIDGHERFGAWNRPNQRGPEEMGWRTTGQNHNLNRDYLKADAPEMQAMLGLVRDWDPLATVDLHVTDGAKFEHDVAVMVEPVNAGDEALRSVGRAWRDGVIADLAQQGSLPLPFYPSFEVEDDPASGVRDSVSPPRFSTGYFLLRNRLAMLVETHSWKDYPTRVRVMRNTIVSVLARIAEHGQAWLKIAHEADERAAKLAGQPVPLDYAATDKARIVPFRGYAYTRTPSDISGALMTRYDENKPEVWQLPLYDEVLPKTVVNAPGAGYLVPAAWAATVARWLDLHGVRYQRLPAGWAEAPTSTWRSEQPKFEATSSEGRQRLSAPGARRSEARSLPPGSLFVPIAQPAARLAIALLEPQAPDGLLGWGVFNNAFEHKEYMEPYVAEEVARAQLAADPALAQAFQQKLANDPAFAASPQARLDFFYRRHSSWDERYGLYPVLRVDQPPPAAKL
ncbi:M14 family metallopeptidase [Ideonella azotifigens]|uniref:M14 family metallopeptidase n=2 Tax=Ideonella azotifigens TaxID=513160 RepID=A0ABP3VAA7_9BURK|nr:M14 family metallopeptidase [Ideonella azotifigens]MCD2343860.1 M14 family metallopeptidase [Ideonella azotifigens]